MSYTIDNCPHLGCQDCKYFRVNADREESICKRIDHKSIKFAKPWFKSYDCGASHIICRDFEPKHPEYTDFESWKGFDDYWKVFKEAWLPNSKAIIRTSVAFTLHDDTSIRYYVLLTDFINGTFIKDGKLLAFEKKYYKQSRKSPIGYELITEKIDGVEI